MPVIIVSGAESEIEQRSQQHADRDVFAGVAAIGKVAHHEFTDSIGEGSSGQDVADHLLVVMKGSPEFFGDGREVIANEIEGRVRDEGGLKNPPAISRVKTIHLRRGKAGPVRSRL